MKIYGKTDVGKLRETNQDTFAYGEPFENGYFAIVCDGMGGQNAGNIASEMAREQITNTLLRQLKIGLDEKSVRNILLSAFSAANQTVYQKACSDSKLSGMGTTAVATVILQDRLFVAHVGDSRAYLLASGVFTRLTQDHSVVEMLFNKGKISKDELKSHPRRNEITRAIGVLPEVSVDFTTESFRKGDKLLLCSDGLTGVCDDEQISQILEDNDSARASERLITLANSYGGTDNITAIVIEND